MGVKSRAKIQININVCYTAGDDPNREAEEGTDVAVALPDVEPAFEADVDPELVPDAVEVLVPDDEEPEDVLNVDPEEVDDEMARVGIYVSWVVVVKRSVSY
ncbi:MAG: hypothetical protein M1829_003774 [Trizodia sp. TS-e1964]|nr:MAG: hypothetical protein M1829_003774 [Trizodia sp. TS-e1964]